MFLANNISILTVLACAELAVVVRGLRCLSGYEYETAKGSIVGGKYAEQECADQHQCTKVQCEAYFGNATSRACGRGCAGAQCDVKGGTVRLAMNVTGCWACGDGDLCNGAGRRTLGLAGTLGGWRSPKAAECPRTLAACIMLALGNCVLHMMRD